LGLTVNRLLGELALTPSRGPAYMATLEEERRTSLSRFSRLPKDITQYVIGPYVSRSFQSNEQPSWLLASDAALNTRLSALLASSEPEANEWHVWDSRIVRRVDATYTTNMLVQSDTGQAYVLDVGANSVALDFNAAVLGSEYVARGEELALMALCMDELGNVVALGSVGAAGHEIASDQATFVLLEVRPSGHLYEITRHASFQPVVRAAIDPDQQYRLSAYGSAYTLWSPRMPEHTATLRRRSDVGDRDSWQVTLLDVPGLCLLTTDHYYATDSSLGPDTSSLLRVYFWWPGLPFRVLSEPVFNFVLPADVPRQTAWRLSLTGGKDAGGADALMLATEEAFPNRLFTAL